MKQSVSNYTYLHADPLGNINATSGVSTTSGAVYFPFGSPRAGNPLADYTFTGQKLDASDGLMYYGRKGSRLGRTQVERAQLAASPRTSHPPICVVPNPRQCPRCLLRSLCASLSRWDLKSSGTDEGCAPLPTALGCNAVTRLTDDESY